MGTRTRLCTQISGPVLVYVLKIGPISVTHTVHKILAAQPIPPEVKVASTVNLPVVISPMYLAPFQLMQTVAVVLWPT